MEMPPTVDRPRRPFGGERGAWHRAIRFETEPGNARGATVQTRTHLSG
jgi:hypothetical protein